MNKPTFRGLRHIFRPRSTLNKIFPPTAGTVELVIPGIQNENSAVVVEPGDLEYGMVETGNRGRVFVDDPRTQNLIGAIFQIYVPTWNPQCHHLCMYIGKYIYIYKTFPWILREIRGFFRKHEDNQYRFRFATPSPLQGLARIHTGKLRVKGDVVAFRMLGRLIFLGILAHLARWWARGV